jgi:hypothetical protein
MVMRYYYAELNETDIVKCVLDTDRPIELPSMISIESFDISLIGQHHVGGGVFEVPE